MNCHCSTAPVGKRMKDVGRKRKRIGELMTPFSQQVYLGREDILEGTAQPDRFSTEGGVLTAKLVPASSLSITDPSVG